MRANFELFEDTVKCVITLKREGDELAGAVPEVKRDGDELGAVPEVEILADNTLLVEFAGSTTKHALPTPVAAGSAKVKWSKGRGTLTFTAARIQTSEEGQAEAASTETSTAAEPSSLPAADGVNAANGDGGSDTAAEGNSNTAADGNRDTAAQGNSNTAADGDRDAAADGGNDTGLQEMYGAELFRDLKHQKPQHEAFQSAQSHSQSTSSGTGPSNHCHAHPSASSLATSSSSCSKPASSETNIASNGDAPLCIEKQDNRATTSSTTTNSEQGSGTTDTAASSSSCPQHANGEAGGCEQANGMNNVSSGNSTSTSISSCSEHAPGKAGGHEQANGINITSNGNSNSTSTSSSSRTCDGHANWDAGSGVQAHATTTSRQASSNSAADATPATATTTTASTHSQAYGTASNPPHGMSSRAADHDDGSHEQGAVPEAQGIDCTFLASTLHGTAAASSKAQKSSKKAAKEEKRRVAPILDAIADSLAKNSWAVCDEYVPMDQVIEVRKELKRLEEHYVEGEIWVGKEADAGATIARKDVRGDVVLWLDQAALEATAYLKDGERHSCSFKALKRVMDSIDDLVKGQLPTRAPSLANVRERSDAMMAIYPGGGSRFAKHIDNTANDGRRLTLLCYLNPNWKPSNGGALRLTPPNGKSVDVYPQAGRLAMFMSKTVAHEVMPTQAPRHSFTLWFYDAIERAEAVATAQVHGRGRASEAEQQEARDLIRDMLSRGGEIQATYEGVAALQNRVARTSRASMGIVASIVGAPSTQALLDSIQHMVPSELENLNFQLAHMGQDAEHAHAPRF